MSFIHELQSPRSAPPPQSSVESDASVCPSNRPVQGDLRNYSVEVSSMLETSLIDNMTSFLEANGAGDVDHQIVRNMAMALTKRVNDTSPGTLQDVTMDNSYGVGYRSPCVSLQQYAGSTSPAAQGRSVREFEEQMASLRKENFNLKLRLYFIEESIPGCQQGGSADGQETLLKQLIDTKVEMEILRKEIQEKQEILKEAAQAMNQMEKIQKETEARGQAVADELRQRIQYLEKERGLEKSHSNSELLNDLLGRPEMPDLNLSALQKVRELEGAVKQSEEKVADLQSQIDKLDQLLAKRDETIREYEDKVKELVFQNAELLEAIELKDKALSNTEHTLRGLRTTNASLREDNEHLLSALRTTQDHCRQEMTNAKTCERQLRDQQDALAKMQSTISAKTAHTARLLERIQEYEKVVTKINSERNIAKRENRFFRAIISKLQSTRSNEYYAFEREEIYEKFNGPCASGRPLDGGPWAGESKWRDARAHGDFCGEYQLRRKLYVNILNDGRLGASQHVAGGGCEEHVGHAADAGDIVEQYWPDGRGGAVDSDKCGPGVAIRYTFSDGSLFDADAAATPKTNSCSSLAPNFSSASVIGRSGQRSEELFPKDPERSQYSPADGIRFVCSKFGKFR